VPDNVETFHHYESPSQHYSPSIDTPDKRRIDSKSFNEYNAAFNLTQPSMAAYSTPHSVCTATSTVVHANDRGFSADSYYVPPWHGHNQPTPTGHGYHHVPFAEYRGDHHSSDPRLPINSDQAAWHEYYRAPESAAHYQDDCHENDQDFPSNVFDAHHHEFHPIPDHVADSCDDQPFYNEEDSSSFRPPVRVAGEYNERDILCGRGALMNSHPGNRFFRRLVQTHRQRYFCSRRQEKKNIAGQVINEIRAHGGRFLRRAKSSDGINEAQDAWVEIDEERAYQKTCQALREGAQEIRKQYRSKSSRETVAKAKGERKHDDVAASK
jgi:hypothetical protein